MVDLLRHRPLSPFLKPDSYPLLWIPPLDVAALRDAIRELLQDPQERIEMAGNCRRIAVEEYALEVQARRYAELYQSVLPHR